MSIIGSLATNVIAKMSSSLKSRS